MSDLRIERVKVLPAIASRKQSTIYLVADQTDTSLVEMYVVGKDVSTPRRLITMQDLQIAFDQMATDSGTVTSNQLQAVATQVTDLSSRIDFDATNPTLVFENGLL